MAVDRIVGDRPRFFNPGEQRPKTQTPQMEPLIHANLR